MYGPGLEAVEDPLQPGPILVFSSPGPGPVLVFFWSYGPDFQSLRGTHEPDSLLPSLPSETDAQALLSDQQSASQSASMIFSIRSYLDNLASAGLSHDFWINVKSNKFARGVMIGGGRRVLLGTGGCLTMASAAA